MTRFLQIFRAQKHTSNPHDKWVWGVSDIKKYFARICCNRVVTVSEVCTNRAATVH